MQISVRNLPSVPFPNDVNTASLTKISLQKLLAENSGDQESVKIFEASKTAGFFVLDLRNVPLGEALMDDADALLGFGEELFALELEEKQKFAMPQYGMSGYKRVGMLRVDNKGTPDRCEFFGVLKDELLGISPLNQPDVMRRHKETYLSFTEKAHEVGVAILAALGKNLHLPHGTLESLHRFSAPSLNQTRLLKYKPQPVSDQQTSLGAHTDLGSITILFNILGGLQIQPNISIDDWSSIPNPSESSWQYIRPAPGCVIVNMGDAMVKFTNGLLRSNLHRVTSAPGDQADLVRYALGYFMRPNNDVLLKRLDFGDVIPTLEKGVVEMDYTSLDWVDVKGETKKVPLEG